MSEFEKVPSNPSSSCQQNQDSPSIQPEDTSKTRETHTEEEKGDREKKRIAELVGQLQAMSEYVKERGGRPLSEEVTKAKSLSTQLARLGYRPRKFGLSPRQLGLNPKASKPPRPTTAQFEEWKSWARVCILRSGSLSAWELQFIESIVKQIDRGRGLSEKQDFRFGQIYEKVYGHG